jgi:hypothetical protein
MDHELMSLEAWLKGLGMRNLLKVAVVIEDTKMFGVRYLDTEENYYILGKAKSHLLRAAFEIGKKQFYVSGDYVGRPFKWAPFGSFFILSPSEREWQTVLPMQVARV